MICGFCIVGQVIHLMSILYFAGLFTCRHGAAAAPHLEPMRAQMAHRVGLRWLTPILMPLFLHVSSWGKVPKLNCNVLEISFFSFDKWQHKLVKSGF